MADEVDAVAACLPRARSTVGKDKRFVPVEEAQEVHPLIEKLSASWQKDAVVNSGREEPDETGANCSSV